MNKRTSDRKSTMEENEELLASFGEAQLLKVNGKIRLQGGAMADRIEAMEWMALFMPDEPVEEMRPRQKA